MRFSRVSFFALLAAFKPMQTAQKYSSMLAPGFYGFPGFKRFNAPQPKTAVQVIMFFSGMSIEEAKCEKARLIGSYRKKKIRKLGRKPCNVEISA
jgi:hypothetical protein